MPSVQQRAPLCGVREGRTAGPARFCAPGGSSIGSILSIIHSEPTARPRVRRCADCALSADELSLSVRRLPTKQRCLIFASSIGSAESGQPTASRRHGPKVRRRAAGGTAVSLTVSCRLCDRSGSTRQDRVSCAGAAARERESYSHAPPPADITNHPSIDRVAASRALHPAGQPLLPPPPLPPRGAAPILTPLPTTVADGQVGQADDELGN